VCVPAAHRLGINLDLAVDEVDDPIIEDVGRTVAEHLVQAV
jgi:hypothetical protein